MKLPFIKPRDKRTEEEQRDSSLMVVVGACLVLHAVYLALLIIFSNEIAFAVMHIAGIAVIAAVYAAHRRGLYGEGAVMLLILCETGVMSVAWLALFGWTALVYCHVACFIVPSRITGSIGARTYRMLQITVCGFTVALIAVGLAVSPLSDGGHTEVYAAVTVAALCAVRFAESLVSRKQMSRKIAGYERKIAGARDESMRDPLTGLWNRRYLEYSCENYEFMSNTTPCTVAMLDLDFFKNVNDTYSHMVGDQVLLYFSTFLKKNLRASDHVIRWGGEEFLIIFTNTDAERTCAVLCNLREDFKAAPMPLGETFVPMTFTAGLCQMKSGMPMQGAIEAADTLLYAGKCAGRDRVVAN